MICLIFIGCTSPKEVIRAQSTPMSSVYVESFVAEKIFTTLDQTKRISYYTIQPKLIEGTENEYSNKSVLVRDLDEATMNALLKLVKDDSSYRWKENSVEVDFSPTKQFVFRSDDERFRMLTNSDYSLVSFINLEGQKIIPTQQKFKDFFNSIK